MNQEPAGPTVAQVFDTIAEVYDQTGVEFFRPVGERLVALLEPEPGERCLDVGCGRGAVTVPLARAVGPSGAVEAVDLSSAMIAATRAVAEAADLGTVTARVGDAADLEGYDDGSFDIVASSLVLFFLPDPGRALRGWVERLRIGGRIGLTTFGPLGAATEEIDALLERYAPPGLLDPRTAGATSPFASDAGMEGLLDEAGGRDVRTVVTPTVVEFPDVEAWHRFAMSTGQRAMLVRVPEDDRPALLARIAAILDHTREDGGPCRLVWQMRYTLGRR